MNKDIVLKNLIKETRMQKGISQEELAKMVGTTRQTIIAIEKGQFNPSVKLALLVAIALDKKIDEIFCLE